MTKRSWTSAFVFLLFGILFIAATPTTSAPTLWYEGEFIDTVHGTLQDGTYSMRFAIFTSTGASQIWHSAAIA